MSIVKFYSVYDFKHLGSEGLLNTAFLWLVREQILFSFYFRIKIFYNEHLFLWLTVFAKSIHDTIFSPLSPTALTCPSFFLCYKWFFLQTF